MNTKIHQLYVYSDIASYTCLGDVTAPILRVVPFETSKEKHHLHQEFVNVHYIPVAKSFIDQVHISIKGDTGDNVPFISGKTLVKLHFKQKKIMRACVRGVMPIQSGKGGLDFPVYRGVSRQYCHGLGSIFKAALRTVAPILKPMATMAKIGLQSAKKVAKEHGIQALKKLPVVKMSNKSACLVFNPITINNFASLFNCTPVGRASDSMMAPT